MGDITVYTEEIKKQRNKTNHAIMVKKTLTEEQWIYPDEEPGKLGETKLLSCALRIAVKVMFETYTYEFGDYIYLQEDGGPIGLRFTACLARVRMNY